MKITVDKTNVKIINKPTLNKGEYGVHKCEFNFTEEYNGLVKVAVFKQEYNTYKVDVVNDICEIPSEILEREGVIKVGVYAYVIEGEQLVLRYSPQMESVTVIQGSFTTLGETPAPVTPTQYEMYSKALNEGLNEINKVVNQLLLDKENGVFNGKDGERGEQGVAGKDGADGKDGYTPVRGVDYWTTSDQNNIKSYIDSQIGVIENGSY